MWGGFHIGLQHRLLWGRHVGVGRNHGDTTPHSFLKLKPKRNMYLIFQSWNHGFTVTSTLCVLVTNKLYCIHNRVGNCSRSIILYERPMQIGVLRTWGRIHKAFLRKKKSFCNYIYIEILNLWPYIDFTVIAPFLPLYCLFLLYFTVNTRKWQRWGGS